MGFDPECIVHPEQVPGEYYCPLCRQLVHPAEVQQTLCGHLFCRPCVLYIVATTRYCPYENHPINEGDPKNLQETNPQVFEAIGRIAVRCLYHKSGCVWQGLLSESAAHSAGCAYGNSPVYCNRCGVQILHRQVQEHAQTCTGISQAPVVQAPQGQQVPDPAQALAQAQAQAQPGASQQVLQQVPGGQVQPAPGTQVQTAADLTQVQSGQPQQAQAAADQWYQQQYQQYYQQQYEQYQQQYQQYEQYQQQYQQQQQQQQAPAATPAHQQYMQTPQPFPVQQPVAQPLAAQQQAIPQALQAAQLHPHHPLTHPQAQQLHPQPGQPQPLVQLQPQPQAHPQQHPFPQQSHPQQVQYPQPHPQMHPQQTHPQQAYPAQPFQPQPHVHPQQQPQPNQPHILQPHPHPQQQPQSQPQPQQQPQPLQPLVLQPQPQQQPHLHQPQMQQTHAHHLVQQQPHPLQPQGSQAQMPVQQTILPQGLPVGHQPQQQPQQLQPVGWAPDGTPQYAQMQQYPQAHWQGKITAGQAVNALAHQPQPHGFQHTMQPRPAHMQPSPQPMRPAVLHAPPNQNLQAIPGAAPGLQAPKQGPPSMQNVNGPPRSQQVQPAQASEKAPGISSHSQPGLHGQQDAKNNLTTAAVDGKDSLKVLGLGASEVASPVAAKVPQKGDNQLEDKSKPFSPEPTVSKGPPGVDAKSASTTDSKLQEPADTKGSQLDTKEDKSETKDEPALPTQVTQSPTKVTPNLQPQSLALQFQPQSLVPQLQQKAKQLQQNPQSQNAPLMQQKETLPSMQPNQMPSQMRNNQNPLLMHRNQGVLPLQPQANQNPPQAHPGNIPPFQQKVPHMQALPHLHHQSPQLQHLQPQLPRPGLHLPHQGQQMQESLLSNASQVTGLSRPQAPAQPQPGAAPFFPAPNQLFQNAPRQVPGEASFGGPQFMAPRPGFPEPRPPLSGQGGPGQQQQGFAQGIVRDLPSQWRPGGLVGFPQEPQSPRIPSPLTPSILAGGPQRGYSDLPGQTFLPPPPHIDAAKSLSVDQNRHLMEQIAAFENETRSGKNFESDKFSGPRPEDSYLLEAQKRLNQTGFFRTEPPLQHPGHRDGSPPRALEFGARFGPGGPLDMPSRAAPRPPLDTEIRARAGIPPEVGAGLFPRPGFPPDVQGGREYPAEFGMSHQKVNDFGGQRNALDDMGSRSTFPKDVAAHLKHPSDAFHQGRSPDFGHRSGPLSEIGSRRSPPHPPFQLDSESRSKFHMDMGSRAPFQFDGDSRPKFSDFDSRPSMLLDSESRLKFSSEPDIPRPPFHMDNFRARFPLDIERPGLHLDADQRAKFPLDRESRPRLDTDIDSRRKFELHTGSSFEERPRPGFSPEIRLQSRFPYSDKMGAHPEGFGLPSDVLGPRGDGMRNRTDSISSMRSPGREPLSRGDGFGSGWREPFGLPGPFNPVHGGPHPLHSGPDFARDNYRFEDPRVKGRDLPPNPLLHESLNSGRPFDHVGRGTYKGGPGQGFPNSFAGHRPPIGSLNGGPPFKMGSLKDDIDKSDFGRKRKQGGSSGWCRICHIDCYTVQGLEEHSKSEEHQKKTLDLVMSIKQDSAKKQKQANPPEAPKESPKKLTPTKQEKAAKPEDDEDEEDDDEEDGSESD